MNTFMANIWNEFANNQRDIFNVVVTLSWSSEQNKRSEACCSFNA